MKISTDGDCRRVHINGHYFADVVRQDVEYVLMDTPAASPLWRKAAYAGAGSMCFAVAGVFSLLPILPGTPFILLGLMCFARASRRFRHWLMHNRIVNAVLGRFRRSRFQMLGKLVQLYDRFMNMQMSLAGLLGAKLALLSDVLLAAPVA